LSPWWLILASLLQKVVHGRWLSVAGRQRQQYWSRGYLKQRQVAGGLAGVEELHEMGIIVATHSLSDGRIQRFAHSANLTFAATGAPEGG
jgi:hypothetical protein